MAATAPSSLPANETLVENQVLRRNYQGDPTSRRVPAVSALPPRRTFPRPDPRQTGLVLPSFNARNPLFTDPWGSFYRWVVALAQAGRARRRVNAVHRALSAGRDEANQRKQGRVRWARESCALEHSPARPRR